MRMTNLRKVEVEWNSSCHESSVALMTLLNVMTSHYQMFCYVASVMTSCSAISCWKGDDP